MNFTDRELSIIAVALQQYSIHLNEQLYKLTEDQADLCEQERRDVWYMRDKLKDYFKAHHIS